MREPGSAAARPRRDRAELFRVQVDQDVRRRVAEHVRHQWLRRIAPTGSAPRSSPPRHGRPARQAGRRRESAPERGARRASALGVVRELVEERRLEVRGGPRRPDEDQARLGLVAGPVRQLPRHADREAVQPARARGDRVDEPLPGSTATARRSSGVPSVNRRPDPEVAAATATTTATAAITIAPTTPALRTTRTLLAEASVGTDLFRPAGSAAADGEPVHLTPADAGWSFSGLRVLSLAPGERRVVRLDGIEACALPLSGSCAVEVGGATFELEGRPDVFSRVSDFVYLPSGAEVAISQRRRLRARPPERAGDASARSRVRPRERRRGRGPRRRARDAADQQLPRRRRVRGRTTDRRRGPHAGRELVVLPAAQARRAHRRRGAARGDLLLPDPGRARIRSASHVHHRRRDRRDGDGPRRRRVPDPARLPRPVRRGARTYDVLPERDGRPGRACMAGLSRPGTRAARRAPGLARAGPQVPPGHGRGAAEVERS